MTTPNIDLPEMPSTSFNPSVPFNESMQIVDALVPLVVQSMALTTPPTTTVPTDAGKRWIPATGATGAWSDKAGMIALCVGADLWAFLDPAPYIPAYNIAMGVWYSYRDSAWKPLPKIIAASGTSNAAQAIPTNTDQKVLLATQDFDYGSFYDPSTSRFTPTVPGIYQFFASVGFVKSGSGPPAGKRLITYLYKNGASIKAYTEASHDSPTNICETTGLVEANGTDYFELYARHDTGDATISLGSTSNTRLQFVYMGAS